MLTFHTPPYPAVMAWLVSGRAVAKMSADRMEMRLRDFAVAIESVMGSSIWLSGCGCTGFASSSVPMLNAHDDGGRPSSRCPERRQNRVILALKSAILA